MLIRFDQGGRYRGYPTLPLSTVAAYAPGGIDPSLRFSPYRRGPALKLVIGHGRDALPAGASDMKSQIFVGKGLQSCPMGAGGTFLGFLRLLGEDPKRLRYRLLGVKADSDCSESRFPIQ